jgi:hypothetical protein
VPEVIEDGVTGMMVDSIDAAVHAVGRLSALHRQTIRRRFEERFSAARMARDYVTAYDDLLDGRAQPSEATETVRQGTSISA